MGRGGQQTQDPDGTCKAKYTWDDVKKHVHRKDQWIVVDNEVYDISTWSRRHPGGSKIISHYAGQDATEAFRAFHLDLNHVKKFLQPIHLGRLEDEATVDDKDKMIMADFEELTNTALKLGYFKPSVTFYVLNIGQLILLEILAYVILVQFGTGWLPYWLSIFCLATVQAQAGWVQHDFGHLSVFKSAKLNHILHYYVMNVTKGASREWWNHLHNQHHAKPNVIDKDPDVRLDALFVVGEEIPKKVAKERKKSMPFNWQHKYFFVIGPPLLFPLYFQIMVFRHSITRRKWLDLALMMTYYIRMMVLYIPILGVWGFLGFYFLVRCVESHWFVWVSQSNHIPMEITSDKARGWVPLQLYATCDIQKSWFNDWFTGHLNFQIEHHLFPRMPRHNLYKVAPLVESLCKKHNIPYRVKPIGVAFRDIIKSLKHSGEIWLHYYQCYH